MATNYSYTYELLTKGKTITKEVGAREVARTPNAAWDFGRRQTRDPDISVVRLIATDDPRVAANHPFWKSAP